MAEMFDVVDEDNNVIGKLSRKEVHSGNIIHRGVHILVFNSKGEVLLQKRSMKKDKYPGAWGDVAGHLDAGESYEHAAARELKEEVGIEKKLEFMMKFRKRADNDQEINKLFKCFYDGPFKPNTEEIDELRFFSVEQIKDLLKDGNVAPGARIALTEYIKSFST
jgi:isopentenyl-diphosphate delta-isomerase type 1